MSGAAAPVGRVSAAEAVTLTLAGVQPLSSELVQLSQALGRVLAEDVASPVTLPPWDNAGMDGYAVLAADVDTATPEHPVALPVAETVPAGGFPAHGLERGTAVRVMTGAPVPSGADSVVRVEDTDGGAVRVRIFGARDAGRNVRPRGEDVKAGAVALAAGTPLGAAQLALLAAVGTARVPVHRRPRVAVLASGNELVMLEQFDEVRAGRRIVSSNSYALEALVRSCGGEPVPLGIAADTVESLVAHLERATGCDLVLTSAGISVGEHDHLRRAVAALGGTVRFWRARMRPGGPVAAGTLYGTPWIGLPGNPVSTLVTFELLARPALRRLAGYRRLFRRPVPVTLAGDGAAVAPGLAHFLRVALEWGEDGSATARLAGPQGSGLVSSMARADALLMVPEGQARVEPGGRYAALLLGEEAGMVERMAW